MELFFLSIIKAIAKKIDKQKAKAVENTQNRAEELVAESSTTSQHLPSSRYSHLQLPIRPTNHHPNPPLRRPLRHRPSVMHQPPDHLGVKLCQKYRQRADNLLLRKVPPR